MKRFACLSVLLAMLAAGARAGGSLESEKVIALLKQNRALWACLGDTMEFAPVAAGVRCGNHWPYLGGARMAPYTLQARPKGEKEYSILVTVECEQRFFDETGYELPMKDGEITDEIIRKAARVGETAVSITLSTRAIDSAEMQE